MGQGCGEQVPAPGAVTRPVVGGKVDSTTKGVVGLGVGIGFIFFGHCTGTLIMPNLVLTARHCVALTDKPGAGVICGQTPFTLQGPGGIFRATVETVRPKADGPKFYKGVGEVFVDKSANDICGYDVALIMLAGKGIPASVATPITPRVDKNAVKDEPMSAAGYGLTAAGGTQSGTRMRIDGRKVLCFKNSCTSWVKPTELGSDAPVCSGDSGGPALDAKGQVIGVLSRGPSDCSSSIYGDVASNKALIVKAAVAAAKSGGYPLPVWAGGSVPAEDSGTEAGVEAGVPAPDRGGPDSGEPAADLGQEPGVDNSEGGCALAGERAAAPLWAALLLLLCCLLRRTRR